MTAGRLTIPRWAFHVLLGGGFLVQFVATHPALQGHSPRFVTWLAGVLTFYVPPYLTLFFWRLALGDWRAAYVGVFVLTLVMALALQRLAPPRLSLRQVAVVLGAWLALALGAVAMFMVVGR